MAKDTITGISAAPREWLSSAFSRVEDVIYIGLGLLLASVAIALLISEIRFFLESILAGHLASSVVMLLDRILLIIIFVEVLYTVQVSFKQRVLQPGPFLVVGLIAVTRRILVLTAELPHLIKEDGELFFNSMIELALLTILIVALVLSIRFIRPRDPNAAAEEIAPRKK